MAKSGNFVVTSLPEYVKNNNDLLLKNFGLVGGDTRKRIGIQTGIKKDAYLNYLDLAPTLQDGLGCGFNAAGTATLTQREINTAVIKIDMTICPDNLIGTYAEYLVRVNADENGLPFEQYIVDGLVAEINKKIEKLIWLGDTTSQDSNLKWIDGLVKLTNGAEFTNKFDITAGASAFEGLMEVYMAMTEDTLAKGAEIYVSPAIFRAFMAEMVTKNYYHYNPGNENPSEFLLPGTDAKVVKTPGLAGSLVVLGTFPKNLVYGCDMESDSELFKIGYDEKTEEYFVKAKWNSGIQVAFPGEVVRGHFQANPSQTPSLAASVATLASAVNEDGQIETHPNS